MNTQTDSIAVTGETLTVPFSKLVEDAGNVRKTRNGDGIEALADNIAAEGLLQNLIVRKAKGGKFAVVGGERRRRALALLVERKAIKASEPIPCRLAGEESTSASLSENIHRQAMHPADQFEAWRTMADSGLSVTEIARRHGATNKLIEQRLRLGRLSPVLLEALRADDISIDVAAAFTITDDHERQKAVFASLKKGYYSVQPHMVKAALTEGEIHGSNKLARLVGRAAYEAAGGEIRTDLFDDNPYFKDADLLQKLAYGHMVAEAERLRGEGWLWIETAFDRDYRWGQDMRVIWPKKVPLTDAEEQEKAEIEARLKEIEDLPDSEELQAEWERLEPRLSALLNKREFSAKAKSNAGGFLSLSPNGTFDLQLGYIRPADDPKAKGDKTKASEAKTKQPNDYGKSLRDDLAAVRLEILRCELLQNPTVTRDLLAFHSLRSVLTPHYTRTPFEFTARMPYGPRTASEKGDMGRYEGRATFEGLVADLRLDWFDIEDVIESFEAFRALSEDDKTRLQAYAAILMLQPQLSDEREAEPTLERTAQIIGSDPAATWTPGGDFFARLTKGHMLQIAGEVVGPDFAERHAKDKKADLATSLGAVFLPVADEKEAYPKARPGIAAWAPACMRPRKNSESDGGLSSPTVA